MDWYYYIAWTVIFVQMLFSFQIARNYRYAMNKYKRERTWYKPKTALFIPSKGIDSDFQKNIASFFNQDYEDYLLWFVVADRSDPAYEQLCNLKNQLRQNSKAKEVKILIAGQTQSCSQKIHNLLHCCNNVSDDIEVLAFADSDACVNTDWLSHIVYPLRQSKYGAASGYRWFVPKKNNIATLAMSAVNAKVAQLLGNSRFNQAWGGSMAIRLDTFRSTGLDKIWKKSLSDDLSLSNAVKKAGLKVAFVPACMVASYESTTWPKLFEFGRRQFLITRIYASRTWRFAFYSSFCATAGLWGTVAIAFYAAKTKDPYLNFFIAAPVLVFIIQLSRAILRQTLISKLLKKDRHKMRFAMAADILFFWLWSLLTLVLVIASAFGRIISWRGIKYKLVSPTETIVISS